MSEFVISVFQVLPDNFIIYTSLTHIAA